MLCRFSLSVLRFVWRNVIAILCFALPIATTEPWNYWRLGGGGAAIASSAAENNCRCKFQRPRHNCNWLVSSRSPARATPRRIIHKSSKLAGAFEDGWHRPTIPIRVTPLIYNSGNEFAPFPMLIANDQTNPKSTTAHSSNAFYLVPMTHLFH